MDEVVAAFFSAFTRWRSLRYRSATRGNFITLAGYLHLPDPHLEKAVAALSGGGLGGGSTCGLLSGGCLAIVAGHMADILSCEGKAEDLYLRTRQFASWFEQNFGGTLCREIIGKGIDSGGGTATWLLKGKALGCCPYLAGRADAKAAELMDRPLDAERPSSIDRRLATRGGYCASQVLAGIRADTGYGSLYLEQLSMALDGGVGLSGGLCGALAGAIMALSYGRAFPSRAGLMTEFKQRFGSLECVDLTARTFADGGELAAFMSKAEKCAEVKEWCRRQATGIILEETVRES
jgi:hypothetical protein